MLAAWSWSAWVRQALLIEGFVVFVYTMEIVLWGNYALSHQQSKIGFRT